RRSYAVHDLQAERRGVEAHEFFDVFGENREMTDASHTFPPFATNLQLAASYEISTAPDKRNRRAAFSPPNKRDVSNRLLKPTVHPSRASGRTARSLKRLRIFRSTELAEVFRIFFNSLLDYACCPATFRVIIVVNESKNGESPWDKPKPHWQNSSWTF